MSYKYDPISKILVQTKDEDRSKLNSVLPKDMRKPKEYNPLDYRTRLQKLGYRPEVINKEMRSYSDGVSYADLKETKDNKTYDGPTKLELIKENQYKYKQFESKSNGYDKFRKLVAQNITLPWIKGSNWIGGISDSNYQRGLEKIAKIIGEDPESIFDKVDSEFIKQQNEVDKIQMKDSRTYDASIEERIESNLKEIDHHAPYLKRYNAKNINLEKKGAYLTDIMYHTRLMKIACNNIIEIISNEVIHG